jgi:hypothetical protein
MGGADAIDAGASRQAHECRMNRRLTRHSAKNVQLRKRGHETKR